MPNEYFDVSIIARDGSAVAGAAYNSGSKVRSCVASAAYHSGEKLHDTHASKTFDYTNKENVLHSEILAPWYTPAELHDRETLWNTVEEGEKRVDSQLARNIIAALPRELTTEQNIALVKEFAHSQLVRRGMIVDFSIHDTVASDGGRNPHVHMQLTLRNVTPDGFGLKNRTWNSRSLVKEWRAAWETITNRHLERAGRSERVSLKSYRERGINKIPQTHRGYQAEALEQRGEKTRVARHNRGVRHDNHIRAAMTHNGHPPGFSPDVAERIFHAGIIGVRGSIYDQDIAAFRARVAQQFEELNQDAMISNSSSKSRSARRRRERKIRPNPITPFYRYLWHSGLGISYRPGWWWEEWFVAGLAQTTRTPFSNGQKNVLEPPRTPSPMAFPR